MGLGRCRSLPREFCPNAYLLGVRGTIGTNAQNSRTVSTGENIRVLVMHTHTPKGIGVCFGSEYVKSVERRHWLLSVYPPIELSSLRYSRMETERLRITTDR
uniref:Uncharacterized protein n=1 Tax=Schistocephalus solidus TaxID=70667 RepID=A0A0V0J6W5_SCHSO